jgi:hypothetical protein
MFSVMIITLHTVSNVEELSIPKYCKLIFIDIALLGVMKMTTLRDWYSHYPKLKDFEFPNRESVYGTTAPVVTTLLSGVSTASFIAALQNGFKEVDIIPILRLSWSSAEAAVVFGISSTILLVAATITLMHAQASNLDSISADKQREIFKESEVNEEINYDPIRGSYRNRTDDLYSFADLILQTGIVLLAMNLGVLVYGYFIWMSCVVGFISLIFVLHFFFRQELKKEFRRYYMLSGIVLTVINLAFVVSALSCAFNIQNSCRVVSLGL